ncbi:hypothetical protein K469DRAFT_8808 [Zopfia rhizophila CBS 207.26]|uniref:Uncharacterized protein n=1 Tax=Zopfia rhizophila CBS 207.26 TaxID=1314779 RepID=A0A6A6EVU9_9PEZI|nr:hypothetical protein K469DRAFT_8808 [Zopfia rhizophila CBS 207.26]
MATALANNNLDTLIKAASTRYSNALTAVDSVYICLALIRHAVFDASLSSLGPFDRAATEQSNRTIASLWHRVPSLSSVVSRLIHSKDPQQGFPSQK